MTELKDLSGAGIVHGLQIRNTFQEKKEQAQHSSDYFGGSIRVSIGLVSSCGNTLDKVRSDETIPRAGCGLTSRSSESDLLRHRPVAAK